jgi:ribonuclease P protein component
MTASSADPAPKLRRLVKRGEFLRAAKGQRAGRSGFSLQAVAGDSPEPGIGLTVSKKVGNAPERNRVKRRLRAAVRTCAGTFHPRHDYVLVGRREALGLPFATLVGDLEALITRIHEPAPARPPRTRGHGAPEGQR